MKIINVAPIGKGAFREELSYFSADDLPVGSIITISVKASRHQDAIIINSRSVEELKTELKNSPFPLKKIGRTKCRRVLSSAFINACRATADHYAITLGQTIKCAVNQAILDSSTSDWPDFDVENKLTDGTLKQHKFILQEDNHERLSYYKALIREAFAKKESVFLCLPKALDVALYSSAFPGINDYTIVLSGEMTPKTQVQNWNKALKIDHPILIIATPIFLSLPRSDIKHIVIENEGSENYRTPFRPFLDYRTLAEKFTNETGARIIYGDLVLRAETIFRAERGELMRLASPKYRSVSGAEQRIVSGKSSDTAIKAIGDELEGLLQEAVANREKIVIYCGQKSLSPVTACGDCGEIVRCENCHSPLALHKNNKEKKYLYLCHKCGYARAVTDICPSCGSWRLNLLGFGLEKAVSELTELFPDLPIFPLDSGVTKPSKRIEAVRKFYNTKGTAILLGTEAMISALSDKIPLVAVVALDAVFSVPDFRISEKVLNTLLQLRQFANAKFIIQTRNPDEKVYSYATAGNLIDFYREEIEERMKFGYPPFKTLILISRAGQQDNLEENIEEIKERFGDYSPHIYEAPGKDRRGQTELRALMKISASSWIHQDLLAKLRDLAPDWKVEVEPESFI